MPITAQAPYGTFEFPDGTDPAVIQRVMKEHAQTAAPDRNDTRGKARVSTEGDDNLSVLDHFWRGLTGKGDATVPGRVGMGMADPAVGMMQMGSRVPVMQDAMPFMPEEMAKAAEPDTKAVDALVQQREHTYEGTRQSANPGEKLGTDWARLIGNVASPVTLAAGGAVGKAMQGVGTAGRLALSAAGGAGIASTEPVTTGKNFGAEKAKQVAGGAVGGAVGGAAGEVVGSGLARAIAGNEPLAVNKVIEGFRRVVKPSRQGQSTAPQINTQDRQIITAVDNIIANQRSLKLTNPDGTTITGRLPQSLRQFTEAIDQTKKSIFQKYDAMDKAAGGKGVKVDLAPTVQALRDTAKKPAVVDYLPNIAAEADALAERLEARGAYTPAEAQQMIEALNQTLTGFYKNPTNETVTRASLLGEVARTLRQTLDKSIESTEGPGYQALRNQYGALKSVEKNVAAAVQREANKVPGGLAGMFGDLAASEEAIRGIITLNPGALARAGGIKAAKALQKHIYNPNRAIQTLFNKAANRGAPPSPSALLMSRGVRGALPPIGMGAGGVAGGELGQFPAMPINP
jgi:hypothetical protein